MTFRSLSSAPSTPTTIQRTAQGIGGQMPVQNGLFITFVLSAWIREFGFRATSYAMPTPTP